MHRTLIIATLAACGSSESAPPQADGAAPPLIDGPVGEWRWYDIPGAICANGSPTGLAVNQGAGDKVVLYMAGGSSCLDEGCSIGTPSMRKDGGFGAAQMQACVTGDCESTFPSESIFARTAATNPFTDATYVFISNCAGDNYAGNGEHAFPSWTAQFHGSKNQALFAGAVASSFPSASRIVLTGGSAGAVGALLNYWQWVDAFPSTRVDLISDSFAFVFTDGPEWHYDLHTPTLPPGCDTCLTDYRTLHDYNARIAAPGSRIAVIDAEDNLTLDFTSGYRYTQGLADLQPRLDALANTKYFIANGSVHILMKYALDSTLIDVDGMHTLAEFLGKMQHDDPAWQSYSAL
jgi:hypothetical protein